MEIPAFSLFPAQASNHAGPVDTLYFFILLVCLFFSVLTAILVLYFAVRYRRRKDNEVPPLVHADRRMEVLWVGGLLALFLSMFFWSAYVYFGMMRPPDDALEIYVVGRQWMWKVQYPDGQRGILGFGDLTSSETPGRGAEGEIHVPVGQPIRIILTSEDVIHSFYIPAFRMKQDAVPGRYTYMWFTPTKAGRYHVFCSEYCGTLHSRMRGTIVVDDPAEYQQWLASKADLSMALRGRQLFLKLQCISCHNAASTQRAPLLENLYRNTVVLNDGSKVVADDDYLRESIRYPKAKIVSGWQPIMPQYDPDRLTETELQQVIAYIKSLHTGDTPPRNERTPPPAVDEWSRSGGGSR